MTHSVLYDINTFQEPSHLNLSTSFSLGRPSLKHTSVHRKHQSADLRSDKKRKTAKFRTSSLDRGRDTNYAQWKAESFQPGPAIYSETDPEHINLLWQWVSVRPSARGQMPERGLQVGSKAGDPRARKPSSTSSQTSTIRSSAAKTTNTTVTEKKPKPASPRDKNFQDRILAPRGITLRHELSTKAYKHFKVENPAGCRFEYYTKERGAMDSSLWLEDDEVFIGNITAEYKCMVQSNFCEAEFASYATAHILKAEPRNLDLKLKRCWRTERTVQLVAKPISSDESVWLPPPALCSGSVDNDYTNYEFDIRPDCTYWLSLQAFSHDYMVHVEEIVLVMKQRILSPYLTIEFKKDDASEQSAINQVAAAASLALYNRFLLRKRAMETLGMSWNKRYVEVIKHYGITFMGSRFDIWCTKPVLTEDYEWAGCELVRVQHGYCTDLSSVRELIDWLNEIHCWGLTVHGPRCEKDIKRCIGVQESGIRVSDIARDSKDENNHSDSF